MAERQLLFTLDYEQFMKNWGESILLFLKEEFDRSKISLSRSLLFYTETENSHWLLVDFENEKAYNIRKEDDTTVGISEGADLKKRSDFMRGSGPILKHLQNVIVTHAGIIDALKRLNFAEYNIEYFERSDLSNQKLSFESVYPELQDVYEMLRDILTSSRESLIGLSDNDVQQIKNYVIQFYDITIDVGNFEIAGENFRETHAALAQKIRNFRETVKQSLLQVATYLSSRKVEQLEDQVNVAVGAVEQKLKKTISSESDRLQKINEEAQQNEEKRQESFDQIHTQLKNQLASEQLTKYKVIFQNQAKKHGKMSWIWLTGTGVLAVGFAVIFWELLTDIGSAANQVSQLSTILSNLFVRGFYISLIFLLLNRTIKNYAAEKHLQVINTHRQNALETFEAFADAAGAGDTREQVLLAARKTIFDTNQSGYLSAKASGSNSASPVLHFIKEAMPSKSSTGSE